MENRPILLISGVQLFPDADPEISERYQKWQNEVYTPLRLTVSGTRGADRYKTVNPSPQYPSVLLNYHIENITEAEKSFKDPDRTALVSDLKTWVDRRVIQYMWSRWYELTRCFRNAAGQVVTKQETMVEDASFLHIEGYRLSPENRDKYEKWMDDYGFSVLIPLIVKLPGIKAYQCYKDTDLKGAGTMPMREWEYPDHLSILSFENQKAFEYYTKSAELLSFQKAIANIFPSGLNYKWYVQYQLTKSWRK
jgi:hypothetical protein